MAAQTTIIGIGNTLMGDDGVGVRVAEALMQLELPPDVEVVVGETAGMGLVGYLLESERVIFADAIDAGVQPGSVFRFDPDDAGVTQLRSNTSHGMSIGHLVTSARLSGAQPEVLVYAVQVGNVVPIPDTLTAPVEAAVSDVAALIAADLTRPQFVDE